VGANTVGLSVRSGADVAWRADWVTMGPEPTAAEPELDFPPEADFAPAGAERWRDEVVAPPVEMVATVAATAAATRIKTPAARGVTERANLIGMPFLGCRSWRRGQDRMP